MELSRRREIEETFSLSEIKFSPDGNWNPVPGSSLDTGDYIRLIPLCEPKLVPKKGGIQAVFDGLQANVQSRVECYSLTNIGGKQEVVVFYNTIYARE